MKTIKTIYKKYDYLFITFIISFLVVTTVFILKKISPFGEYSMLKIDFYHQYGPMLGELYDRIKTGKSLIYSFNTGLGLPFFRNFFNYLSSVFNIIMLLFKRNDLLTSYSIIIGLKAVTSSLTCVYYLKKKFDSNNFIIGLSILYAFSSYFIAYYWNIMWIDGLYILPLLALGIENIINKNNGVLYTMSLVIILFTNYFIGYMLCIFSVLYFILYFIKKINIREVKKNIKIIIKFIVCSLISGMLLAFQLIPMFSSLLTTDATTGTMPTEQYYAFTFFEFIKNHLSGVYSTVLASGISNCPNISSGILSITLFILFILNNKIKLRTKITYLLFMVILFFSFYIAPLDYIWHAFHVPNDLPYRYSFIYSFILIIISAYTLNKSKDIPIIKVIISFIITIILVTVVYFTNYENISKDMILINYILLVIYFLIYILYKKDTKCKNLAIYIFIIVCGIESVISINTNWNINQSISNFYSDYKEIENKKNNITDEEKFFRIEKTNNLTLNDGAWYNYYGQEIFSSMSYGKLAKLNSDLGSPGNRVNSYYYKENTPIYDLIFDLKYTYGERNDNTRYSKIDDGFYKYEYTSGLMFAVNNSIKNWKYDYSNPLEYQNNFASYSTNTNNIFYRLSLIKKEYIIKTDEELLIKYTYKNDFDNFYLYTNDSSIDYIIINNKGYYKDDVDYSKINKIVNTDIIEYNSYNEEYIITEKEESENIEVLVHYNNRYDIEPDIYTINNDRFTDFYNIIKDKKVNINVFKENYIKGTIKLDKGSTIFTSIPYDKGWKVYSNNKEINTFKINDCLLGFDLKKGENNIELKYIPEHFDLGICMSISTIIGIITYLSIKKKRINHLN